jgi:hypothetical protein
MHEQFAPLQYSSPGVANPMVVNGTAQPGTTSLAIQKKD